MAAVVVLAVLGCASVGTDRPSEAAGTDTHIAKGRQGADDPEAELMFELMAGEMAGHLGDVKGSGAHYVKAAQLSEDPAVAERATRITLFAGEMEAARKAAERWTELVPDNLDAQQTLAILYLREGQAERAIAHFERVIATAGPQGKGFLLVGATLEGEKGTEQALKVMRRLVEHQPQSAQAHLAYAHLALKAGRYPVAVSETTRALQLDPTLVDARTVRAGARFKFGETEQALQDMAVAVEARPKNTELRINYGRMLVQAKHYDQARSVFGALIREQPESPDLLYTLGLLNMQEQRYKEASGYLKRLIDTGKRTDEGYYYLGRIAEERKAYQEALGWYRKVSEGEYYLDAQSRVAAIYVELGDFAKARAHLATLRNQTSDVDIMVRLYLAEGQLLREAKRYKDAMDLYNQALARYPGNTDLLYARALIAEKLNRVDLLEADLKAILDEEPNNATALNALGYTLADRNERIPEALSYIKKALEVKPDDPTVIDSMGWVQYRMGNYREAERYLRKAYGLLEDPEIAGHLSEIMWTQGHREQALEVLNKALNQDPKDDYLRELKRRFSQ
jgi:tetratricopeptide (TPR) repeat protein